MSVFFFNRGGVSKDPKEASLMTTSVRQALRQKGNYITILEKCTKDLESESQTRSDPQALRPDPEEVVAQQPPCHHRGASHLGQSGGRRTPARSIEAMGAGALHP
jgi:hypothetical protein